MAENYMGGTANLMELLHGLQYGPDMGGNIAGADPRAKAIQQMMQMMGAGGVPNLPQQMPGPRGQVRSMRPTEQGDMTQDLFDASPVGQASLNRSSDGRAGKPNPYQSGESNRAFERAGAPSGAPSDEQMLNDVSDGIAKGGQTNPEDVPQDQWPDTWEGFVKMFGREPSSDGELEYYDRGQK